MQKSRAGGTCSWAFKWASVPYFWHECFLPFHGESDTFTLCEILQNLGREDNEGSMQGVDLDYRILDPKVQDMHELEVCKFRIKASSNETRQKKNEVYCAPYRNFVDQKITVTEIKRNESAIRDSVEFLLFFPSLLFL